MFGLSGETLARVHGDQNLKRAVHEFRIHLSRHDVDEWFEHAVMAYLKHQSVCAAGPSCDELAALWRALIAARDALLAALGVTR